MVERARKKENTLTSRRLADLATLVTDPDVSEHVRGRFVVRNITSVPQDQLNTMIAGQREHKSIRLSEALKGNFVPPASYSGLNQFNAEREWTSNIHNLNIENLDATIFLDEEQNPLVIYRANDMPLEKLLQQQNKSEQFEKISSVLNDNLLASLEGQGVVYRQDGKLCKDGQVLSAQELKDCVKTANYQGLTKFAKKVKVEMVSTDPNLSYELVEKLKGIQDGYKGTF
jgi:hypothetical protein